MVFPGLNNSHSGIIFFFFIIIYFQFYYVFCCGKVKIIKNQFKTIVKSFIFKIKNYYAFKIYISAYFISRRFYGYFRIKIF